MGAEVGEGDEEEESNPSTRHRIILFSLAHFERIRSWYHATLPGVRQGIEMNAAASKSYQSTKSVWIALVEKWG